MDKIAIAAIAASWIGSGVVVYILGRRIKNLQHTTQSLTAMVIQLKGDVKRVPNEVADDVGKALKRTVVDMAFMGVKIK